MEFDPDMIVMQCWEIMWPYQFLVPQDEEDSTQND